jgi:hypothetical protein
VCGHGIETSQARKYVADLFAALASELRTSDVDFGVVTAAHATPGGLNQQSLAALSRRGSRRRTTGPRRPAGKDRSAGLNRGDADEMLRACGDVRQTRPSVARPWACSAFDGQRTLPAPARYLGATPSIRLVTSDTMKSSVMGSSGIRRRC